MTDFKHLCFKRMGNAVSYMRFADKAHKVVGLAAPNDKMLFETIAR